jgi:hypothetical protein
MFIPLVLDHPQMIGAILRGTPTWVWGLLAGLVFLGLTQIRDRTASLLRVSVLPLAMTSLSIWGITGAFGKSPMFGYVMLAWMLVAAIAFAALGMTSAPKGTTYDAGARTFFLPGSWLPLAMILGVFFTRYVVNVDIAMNPMLTRDGQYTIIVAAMYGLFTGAFLGRAARLWRLAAERGSGFVLQRGPNLQ